MIFISHKNDPDHDIALRIGSLLKENGISYWIAPESIKGGKDFSLAIPPAINACEIFLLILSEHTCKSEHVRKEVMLAMNHKKTIIPLKIGDFELDDSYEYLLANIQIIPFSFEKEDVEYLVNRCRLGERVVEMEITKNPRRILTIGKGDYNYNMDDILQNKPEELKDTYFAIGIDCSSKLSLSSNKGILKWVCAYLKKNHGITMKYLQDLVNKAKMEQLGHKGPRREMNFKDIVTIQVPIENDLYFNLMLVANSRKKKSYYATNDVDEVEGIDSREIIIAVFNKCQQLGDKVKTLCIGAMGTNGLAFPYEVITSEILNCYIYAQRMNFAPRNLYYSVRKEDLERVGMTVDDMLSYIETVIYFFRD